MTTCAVTCVPCQNDSVQMWRGHNHINAVQPQDYRLLDFPQLYFSYLLWVLNTSLNSSHVVHAYMQEQGRILVRELMPGCAQLYISDVDLDDAGVYLCESGNYIGVERRTATIEIGCNYGSAVYFFLNSCLSSRPYACHMVVGLMYHQPGCTPWVGWNVVIAMSQLGVLCSVVVRRRR